MQRQQHRDPQKKFRMFGLMAKKAHSQKRAKASPCRGDPQKRGFRDPPGLPFRFLFVSEHKKERSRIDCYQVNDQDIHGMTAFLEGME